MRLFGRRDRGTSRSEEETARRVDELTRSRRAVAEAYERERRRIERDLHDGAQQYFVAASMAVGEARLTGGEEALAKAQHLVDEGLAALRRTVHGIHPSELREFGLVAAIGNAAEAYGSHVKIRCPNPLPPMSPGVLAAAYFFAAEALTNAARYAPGVPVTVLITSGDMLRVSVVDSGPGGAVTRPQGGLAEMADRLAGFDGTLSLSSPAGGPTQVVASIPMMLVRGESGVGDEQ